MVAVRLTSRKPAERSDFGSLPAMLTEHFISKA
jgi:hypothetical protein